MVSKKRVTEKGVYFQAQSDEQSKWKEFKINFIATNRDDIELGTASVYHPTLTPTNTV